MGIFLMALTYGLTLFGLSSGLCPLGFAFFNPTTTIGAMVSGRLGVPRALLFLAVQLVGSLAGIFAAVGLHSSPADSYCVSTVAGTSNGGLFIVELVSSVAVTFVSVCVYNDRRNAGARWPSVYSSLSFGIIIAAAKASGSAANPTWRYDGRALLI